MAGWSTELMLMFGYAVFLACISFALGWIAHHAHRRSQGTSTAGFTYDPGRDTWRCPRDHHLFPVFSDRTKVIYRAPADVCNSCISKAACTDSDHGREIEQNMEQSDDTIEHGVRRFHRGVSLTLLLLASSIMVIELFRTSEVNPRIVMALSLLLFYVLSRRLTSKASRNRRTPA